MYVYSPCTRIERTITCASFFFLSRCEPSRPRWCQGSVCKPTSYGTERSAAKPPLYDTLCMLRACLRSSAKRRYVLWASEILVLLNHWNMKGTRAHKHVSVLCLSLSLSLSLYLSLFFFFSLSLSIYIYIFSLSLACF